MTTIGWINLVLDIPGHAMPRALEAWEHITGCTASSPGDDANQLRTMQPASGPSWLKVRTLAGDVPRVHMELCVDDVEAAVAEAESLGCTIHSRGDGVVVMRAPDSVRFAITTLDPAAIGTPVRDLDAVVDQVCIDVPSRAFPASVDFWSRFTGWQPEESKYDDFAALARPDDIPVRITFQRSGQGEASCHPDLAAKRAVLTVRDHVAHGSVVEDTRPRWTVMVGPSGMRYCITERNPVTGHFE